jgi:hypothetical protein
MVVHFFNPDCPCSRFNLEHLRRLVERFGDRVQFVAAVQADDDRDAAELEDALAALDLRLVHFVDRGAAVARAAGVYSTPQAVVLARDGRLVYRGNYNTSRYCTDPRTEFVRIALDHLVDPAPPPGAPLAGALESSPPAYGCRLPADVAELAGVTER